MNKVAKKRLGDIVNFKRGYDLPSYNRRDGNYPIISSSGISGFHSEFKAEGEGLITGRYGTLGEMYYINGKYWPHNTALYVTDFKGNYPKYTYFLLKSLGSLKTSDKSTVPGVNRNDLHEIVIPYIKPEFQKPLADCLFNIDSKIELNNRVNRELEQMAKLLYDYWFVQFEFSLESASSTPGGAVPELVEGKPYKTSGGKMVWNAELKREIPEGWKVGTISVLAELLGGGTPKTKEPSYWGGLIPFFTPTDNSNSAFSLSTRQNITEAGLVSCSSKLFSKGTIFITARGTVGNINIASQNMAMNQSCYALKARENVSYSFLYLYAHELVRKLKAKANGSVFDAIVSNDFKLTNLVVPPIGLINKFGTISESIFEKILNNQIENGQLASLRDWLLPMLMNGQVTVGANEKVNYEVTGGMDVAAEPRGYWKKPNAK